MAGASHDRLPLEVPRLRPAPDPSVEKDPAQVRRWAAELPQLNPVACVEALGRRLQPLASEPLEPDRRLALAEAYRPAVLATLHSMTTRTLRGLPLPPEARRQARAALVPLCQALAANYKHIVRAALHAGARAPEAAPLAIAWFRALEHTGWVLAAAWRAREDPPPFTWLELHQLHLHAHRRGLEAPQPVPGEPPPPAGTLGALYSLWLVAAATDPYRFDDGEQERLLSILAPATGACRLLTHPCAPEPGRLGLDPDADSPPTIAMAPRGHTPAGPACLHMQPILDHLERLAADGSASALDRTLAARALSSLRPGDRRRAERRVTTRTVFLGRGIGAIHALAAMPPARLEELVQGQGLGMSVLSLESDEESAVALDPWQVINESVRGLMAKPARQLPELPSAGEAVAIVDREGEDAPWQVRPGLVRWVRHASSEQPLLGLEHLPGRMAPVAVRSGGRDRQAVYLGPVPPLRLPARLLCPSDLAPDSGQQPVLEIHISGRWSRARVAGTLECTEHTAVLALTRA